MKKEIIVAFHVGRGGRFHNAGHLSFIGEHSIDYYTDDLFLRWSNEREILSKINGRPNLLEKWEDSCDSDDYEFFERLGFDLGEKEWYCGASGSSVGLTADEAATGIGTINIDYGYDTTYTKYIGDCSEKEIELILESKNYTSYESDKWLEENYPKLVEEFKTI